MRTSAYPIRCLLIVAVRAPAAAARDIHVDNVAGDDHFTGAQIKPLESGTGPVRTIGRALEMAHRGDRIILADTGQPYRESISLVGGRHSGYPFAPFTIEGNGAVLDGAAPVPHRAWAHFRNTVFRFRPARLEHQQLFLNGRPVPQVIADRLADRPPKLNPIEWCLYDGHIYFCTEPMKRPEDYSLTYAAKPVGITLYHVDHVEITNLTVQAFQLDGINAYNSARHVSLGRIVARGNGRAGISVGGASLVSVEACLLGNNGRAQLLTHPYGETHLLGCQLLSNTAPGWVDQGGRVWIDGRRVEGGLDQPAGTDTSQAKPAADAPPRLGLKLQAPSHLGPKLQLGTASSASL